MRILIIRLSSIGDVVESTAVASALKDSIPGVRIDWLVSPPAAELLTDHPAIDEVLLWDRRPFDDAVRRGHFFRALHLLLEARTLLRGRAYDVVLDIQDLFLTGLLSRFADTKRRIGIVDRHEGTWLFIPERIPSNSTQKLHHYLDALTALGMKDVRQARPHLPLPSPLQEAVRVLLKSRGIPHGLPYLAVSVQSSWKTKEWPAAHFAAALSSLPAALPIVFIGSLQDEVKIDSICERIRKETAAPPPLISLAGCTTLLELAAVLQDAVLYFGPDTGPLHIASAVGTPTLSLWGATHPAVHAPPGAHDYAIVSPYSCQGCGKTRCRVHGCASPPPCMTAITPAMVKAALTELLHINQHI